MTIFNVILFNYIYIYINYDIFKAQENFQQPKLVGLKKK